MRTRVSSAWWDIDPNVNSLAREVAGCLIQIKRTLRVDGVHWELLSGELSRSRSPVRPLPVTNFHLIWRPRSAAQHRASLWEVFAEHWGSRGQKNSCGKSDGEEKILEWDPLFWFVLQLDNLADTR
jgi:hypothetical protein